MLRTRHALFCFVRFTREALFVTLTTQVSELISKLEQERNELQEQLERAATREAEVLQQVRFDDAPSFLCFYHAFKFLSALLWAPRAARFRTNLLQHENQKVQLSFVHLLLRQIPMSRARPCSGRSSTSLGRLPVVCPRDRSSTYFRAPPNRAYNTPSSRSNRACCGVRLFALTQLKKLAEEREEAAELRSMAKRDAAKEYATKLDANEKKLKQVTGGGRE